MPGGISCTTTTTPVPSWDAVVPSYWVDESSSRRTMETTVARMMATMSPRLNDEAALLSLSLLLSQPIPELNPQQQCPATASSVSDPPGWWFPNNQTHSTCSPPLLNNDEMIRMTAMMMMPTASSCLAFAFVPSRDSSDSGTTASSKPPPHQALSVPPCRKRTISFAHPRPRRRMTMRMIPPPFARRFQFPFGRNRRRRTQQYPPLAVRLDPNHNTNDTIIQQAQPPQPPQQDDQVLTQAATTTWLSFLGVTTSTSTTTTTGRMTQLAHHLQRVGLSTLLALLLVSVLQGAVALLQYRNNPVGHLVIPSGPTVGSIAAMTTTAVSSSTTAVAATTTTTTTTTP
eukprot:CAMPEP_0168844152 /NCGR_PEP_ID=MMETSP0727-20121128/8593_1 /TAXON_ID=265536 /ORGANISM="Amphiprora sp., Strain CCMP467" /LENGTH=342 /DNA_ID=CAMNT_0008897793 /DNA_START=23 /DNA_END=1047 /DNA_ORIENTATION=+